MSNAVPPMLPSQVRDAMSKRAALQMVRRALLVVLLLAVVGVKAATKVALVIGNSAYPIDPLDNPAKDATAVGEALARLGFTVVEVRDGTRLEMMRSIERARLLLHGREGIGLFYFAGHALQLEWRNYLVPIDAKLGGPRDVATQTIDVQGVLEAFKSSGNRMSIVVLDACRNNPFGATGRGLGLAQMDAPSGTFLAFSTAPGNVAEDGTAQAGNSLYTKHLVEELGRPRARIEDVFKRVRLQVRQKTLGRQIPWESTSLEEEFYFDRTERPSAQAVADPATRTALAAGELQAELAEWQRIATSTRPDDFYDFLRKYPNGLLSEQAQFRLSQLQAALVEPVPRPDGIAHLPAGANRFSRGDMLLWEYTDLLTKQTSTLRWEVTFADRDRVEINHGAFVYDQMGNNLRDHRGTKRPPQMLVPADIALGKTWRTATEIVDPQGGRSTVYWDSRVVALEHVDLPAGPVRAYRVERVGWSTWGGGMALAATLWIDPTTMLWVKLERDFRIKDTVFERNVSRLKEVRRATGR